MKKLGQTNRNTDNSEQQTHNVYECAYICVCVLEREGVCNREREREYVCLCVQERERKK